MAKEIRGGMFCHLKFIYSEKATKYFEISLSLLSTGVHSDKSKGGDFAKFCGLLKMYELYYQNNFSESYGIASLPNFAAMDTEV